MNYTHFPKGSEKIVISGALDVRFRIFQPQTKSFFREGKEMTLFRSRFGISAFFFKNSKRCREESLLRNAMTTTYHGQQQALNLLLDGASHKNHSANEVEQSS